MIEELPNILDKHLQMLTQQSGFNMEEHRARIHSSGPFAEAKKRQSIWAPPPSDPQVMAGLPIGVGGQGNTSALQQLKALENTSEPVVIPPTITRSPEEPYTLVPAVDESSRAKMMEQQDQARAAKERAVEKARIKKLMGIQ